MQDLSSGPDPFADVDGGSFLFLAQHVTILTLFGMRGSFFGNRSVCFVVVC